MAKERNWTSEEDQFLKENFQEMTSFEIASKINRTRWAVRGRSQVLGLKKKFQASIGEVYGKLTVIADSGKKEGRSELYNRRKFWICKCECGNECIKCTSDLKFHETIDCGCSNTLFRQKDPGHAGFKNMYSRYKYACLRRNHEFNLSIEEFIYLAKQNCKYCGSEPIKKNPYLRADGTQTQPKINKRVIRDGYYTQETIDRAWITSNGIDRIDSNKGYSLDNCVPCCTICNEMKMDRTVDQFMSHVRKILGNQK